MKTPEQLQADITRRVKTTWAQTITDPGTAWPHTFPLGEPTSAALVTTFPATMATVHAWRQWQQRTGLRVTWRARRVAGTDQELPTHVTVPDLDTAAALAGGDWPARVTRGRDRAAVLAARYRHLPAPGRTLAAVDALSDVDFDLLCRAADWFTTHDGTGLTPRQVPVAGLHAKWLNTRHTLVRDLAGVPELGLLGAHPSRLHFTYLDPGHRAAGGRHHDSATVGDHVLLPYTPQVVLISENKDTAVHFPPVPGGVAVEGGGSGGSTVASFGWITGAASVLYWGDMDADGLEILDGFRAAGVPAASVLMDLDTYTAWEQFGTHLDKRGAPLGSRAPRPLLNLTKPERALYEALIDPGWTRVRRVEQERIPLQVAAAALAALHR